ncbi:DNA repair protein SWI5 homolog, partial [Rhinoderma darwinii]|uniref:DNA repair protein SWI5 homolog n=1 Tax=Rhinoderma darwinii TaxID=43563 RepID=UPI003F679846
PGVREHVTTRNRKRPAAKLESPSGQGLPQSGGSLCTPAQKSSSLTPRPRSSLHRTPLGIRGRCNSRFKSPVQSPSVCKSSGSPEDVLQRDLCELKLREASLDKEIEQLHAEGYSTEELDQHISLLHEYNELKDTGQMLLGRLAVLRGVTTKDLYAEFGLDLED